MRPAIKLELTTEQQQSLEQWMRSWNTAPVVRLRSQLILLKAQGRSAEDISSIVGMCPITVHSWVKRYRSEGISGLLTKAGRGRKKRLHPQEDAPAVELSLQEHRQSLKAAKAAFEAKGGKQVSEDTLRAFLKVVVIPIKESAKQWVKSRPRSSMNIS
jgi:transposase